MKGWNIFFEKQNFTNVTLLINVEVALRYWGRWSDWESLVLKIECCLFNLEQRATVLYMIQFFFKKNKIFVHRKRTNWVRGLIVFKHTLFLWFFSTSWTIVIDIILFTRHPQTIFLFFYCYLFSNSVRTILAMVDNWMFDVPS